MNGELGKEMRRIGAGTEAAIRLEVESKSLLSTGC